MCTGSARGFIVVGVDDRAESLNAARYAVELADAHGLCVRLVHAFGPPVGYGQYGALNLGRRERTAHALLSTVRERIDVPEGVGIEYVVDNGTPVDALTEAGTDSRLVVIGRRERSWAPRLLRRHVAPRLSARSVAPVLTVPAVWRYPDQHDRQVVVGLDGAASAHRLLAFAFAHADQLQTSVLVVHAVPDEQGTDHDPTELWQALAHWRARYPNVAVDVQVANGDPEQLLAQASDDASLLVVGRPGEDPGFGAWWSWLPTALVSRSFCPVAVVPAALADSGAAFAQAGHDATTFETSERS